MNYIRKLASDTAIYGLSTVVPRLLNYFLVPLYTRVFLPEQYGIITEMYAYLGILLVLLTYGMETGFFRYASSKAEAKTIYSTAFYSLFTSSSLFIVLTILFSKSIVSVLGYPNNPEFIVYLSLIIGIDSFSSIPFAKLRLQNKAFVFAVIKVFGVTLNIFLNLFFLVLLPKIDSYNLLVSNSPTTLVNFVFISNLVSSFIVVVLLVFKTGGFPVGFNFSKLRELLLYSFPLLVGGLGGTTNETMDRIFIVHLVGEENNPLYQLGIYGSNVKLAVLMVLFVQMYRYAAEPLFFSTYSNKDSKILYSRMLTYFTAFTMLIFLGVGLFLDVLKFFVGERFREGLSVVPILLLANVFFGIYFNLSIWFKLINKTWYGVFYTFSGAVVTILLNFMLIPSIGFYGAAIARLACYIVMCILCYYGGQKYFKINYDIKRIFLYIFAAIIIFILGYYIVISSFFYSIVFRFFLLLFFISIFLIYEKINIFKLIKLSR